jgi:hypothetical protein
MALLPPPIQLLVQVRPAALFADQTLALAAVAFLGAVAIDGDAAAGCAQRLSRDPAAVVTYAWTGGKADGWILLADAALDPENVRTCLKALGVDPPPGGEIDPPPGRTVPLEGSGELLLSRLGPDRRAVGLAPTVFAVRGAAALTSTPAAPPADPEEVFPRLRQGDVKFFADLDELAALGASDLPLVDDADRVGLSIRLEAARAAAVALVHARSAPAASRVRDRLEDSLTWLRRMVLDEPGVTTAAAYRVFDEALLERLGNLARLELDMDRPTLRALVGLLAHQVLPAVTAPEPPRVEPLPAPPPPADADAHD